MPLLSVATPQAIPEVLANRANELVQTIIVNTNEVMLNIYDDGAIDNDTVTVFLDKKMVVAHAMLTTERSSSTFTWTIATPTTKW